MGKIKVMRVVIDTNVIISALLFGGRPGQLIPLWQAARIRPLAGKEIIDEYIRVLAYPKFSLSEDDINFLVFNEILPYFDIITIKPDHVIIGKDPSDDKFIHCAEAGNANVIISGDDHLAHLKQYHEIRILTPVEFLQEGFSASS